MTRNTVPMLVGLALITALPAAHAADKPATSGDAALIASAMSAAPAAVAKKATIINMAADGKMTVLRKGGGLWTCMPDNPATPGPDPMCWDRNADGWVHAWMGHTTPPAKVGFMYMLEGGTDASNTDPYATQPTAENHWVKTGPHIMIVGAANQMAGYPRSPEPDTTKPYVMWANTPYEHLMIPVQ